MAVCKHGVTLTDAMIESNWWRFVNRCPCGKPERTQEELDAYTSELMALRDAEDLARLAARRISPALDVEDRPGGWYFITFTQPDTDKTVNELIKSTMKVVKSKMVRPTQWCYSLELTAKGTPHSHLRLFSDKYPEYKKIGAFNRGFRFEVQREKFFTGNYVVKEESKPTPELLSTWGLDTWFFCSDNYTGPRPDPDLVELNSPALV